jgi:hypothetical protein
VTLPLEAIRQAEDRTHSEALVRALGEAKTPEERADIVATLERLEDPRTVEPLMALLTNRTLPAAVRANAGAALRLGHCMPEDRAQRRAFWASSDAILMEHALLSMDAGEADIVVGVAGDAHHKFQSTALTSMTTGFETEPQQRVKILALGHATPRVRDAAANALHWDSPIAAIEPLLQCAYGSDPKVAVAALGTLRYYPSRRVLSEMAKIRETKNPAIARAARTAFNDIREAFLSRLRIEGLTTFPWVRKWMDPVWPLLDADEDDLSPESRTAFRSAPQFPRGGDEAVDAFVRELGDLDGPWAAKKERLRTFPWSTVTPRSQPHVRAFLVDHPDPAVRIAGAYAFAAWNEYDALLRLADDPLPSVRRAAIDQIGEAAPRAEVAPAIWKNLSRPGTSGTHARETVKSYVVHAPQTEAARALSEAARFDARESVRCEAIRQLQRLGRKAELVALAEVLREKPKVTWALHIAILDALYEVGVIAKLHDLPDGDDAQLQGALAPHAIRR